MPKAKVLLIEDDAITVDMYEAQFEIDDVPLAVAKNGHEGLVQAKKLKPALILLDVQMEDMNGLEVLRELKKDKSTANIAVIILSNTREADCKEQGLKLGAMQYVMKAKILPKDVVHLVQEQLAHA